MVVIAQTLDVASRPVTPTTSAGDIAPTAEVIVWPANPTISCVGVIAPTAEVANCPDKIPVKSMIGVIDPTLEVAETPVSPMTSATFKTKSPPQETPTSPESEELPQP